MIREKECCAEHPQNMSRRQFLRRVLTTAFIGTTTTITAFFEYKTGLPSLILTEKVPIWVESAMDYANDKVELSRNILFDENTYMVEQIIVDINPAKPLHVSRAKLTFIQYKSEASIQLKPTPSGRRELLLGESTGVSGPVAPVSGDYEYSKSNGVEQREINMQMPACDEKGKMYGPESFVDRLPHGVISEINISVSGGLVFKNGSFTIVDKAGLEKAKHLGESYMQAWFTINEDNEKEVLSQVWTHQRVNSEIGNSVYTWSAYIEYTNNIGQKEKGLIVLNGGKDRLALWHLVKVCKKLSHNGRYKLALMDAGNGNPVFIRPKSDEAHYYSIGDRATSAHYSPLSVFTT